VFLNAAEEVADFILVIALDPQMSNAVSVADLVHLDMMPMLRSIGQMRTVEVQKTMDAHNSLP
jgi:hypothetical protein